MDWSKKTCGMLVLILPSEMDVLKEVSDFKISLTWFSCVKKFRKILAGLAELAQLDWIYS